MKPEKSKKIRALQAVYGRPWWQVALEAANEPLSQSKLAVRWTAAVSATYPHIRYSQQDVCRIIARAIERASELAADSAA
mgnify:CR=1 FL=1